MKITFLGTGASHGIPVIGCNCPVCLSEDNRDKRLRSSVWVETGKNQFVIDAGPDFRQQMLSEKITHIDAVLLTHEHKDHTAGLDDLRAFNYLQKRAMKVFGEERVMESIRRDYSYVFSDERYPGAPELDLQSITGEPFDFQNDQIIPIKAFHHQLPVLGFRFGNLAYVTDAKVIPEPEKEKLLGLEVLVLSALRIKPHVAHMGLDEALETISELKPKRAFLSHISHMQMNYAELSSCLPEGVWPAYDGLKVEI